ncbi:TIM barrel protein [Rhodospirillaceae bacterium KN72]|uniref:TIM barrel protein n=1 Tax=Pacificispira spongiicola TaxID=2729598 RepID=A0A7Y0DY02_9PROT|nr:TIM barrel protein [Pacificispira spongiicola]NMM43679.1 TIM barrel protein [Pacificispira spongiicola]
MSDLRFSANLGFLWTDRSLPDAVRAAKVAGFEAVELHWPYETDTAQLKAALAETGLPVLGVNTLRGDVAAGEFGLAAVPGREEEARRYFERALGYAEAIGVANIHVMAGKSEGTAARQCFIDHLRWARDLAAPKGVGILIEPLNLRDVPGYFLTDCAAAADIVADCGGSGIRIMFDCYHMQIMGGDIVSRFQRFRDVIGHVQFAAVPDRTEPDHGELDHAWLLPELLRAGWHGFFGAEYKPRGKTDIGLNWMTQFR